MTQLTAGKPEPLGASFDGKGVNFTLFSAHAERVELCVFDGEGNEHRYDLPARTGDTWHGYLAGGRPGMHYGFRVHGPWERGGARSLRLGRRCPAAHAVGQHRYL